MITKGLEDYIEFIYNKISNKENVKAIDIAKHFEISRSSVSEALIRLADMNLIIYEGRNGIQITQEGEKTAEKIIKKHKILFEFFNNILGIEDEISNENACKIEHVIDDDVIKKIFLFTSFCKESNLDKKFKDKN